MSDVPAGGRWTDDLVRLDGTGGVWHIHLSTPGHAAVTIGPIMNPAVAQQAVKQLRSFLTEVARRAAGPAGG